MFPNRSILARLPLPGKHRKPLLSARTPNVTLFAPNLTPSAKLDISGAKLNSPRLRPPRPHVILYSGNETRMKQGGFSYEHSPGAAKAANQPGYRLATIQKLHIKFTDIRPGWIRTPLLDDDRNYPMIMQLPYAVPRIIRAIRRRRRVSVVDWRWNILVGLWRLIPNSLWVRLPVPVETIASRNQQHLNAAEASYGDFQP